jgi:hypothetical protein
MTITLARNFTSDWLTDKLPAWRDHVVPRLRSSEGSRWLDIGSYEGRSALYTLDHVLGPKSAVFCVDVFDDDFPGLETWGQRGYATRFDANTIEERRSGTIIKLPGWTHVVLASLQGITLDSPDHRRCSSADLFQGTKFHGAYLDGDHQEHNVRRDLNLLWPLLLPDAVLVCDDYDCPGQPGARIAIDEFLDRHSHDATALYRGFQLIMVKRPRSR